jgi:hypothetical protein
LNRKATHERSEVSGLKDVLGWLDGKHEELRETVAGPQEAITARGSKVKEDLGNVQGELAKMKEEIRAMKLKPNSSTPIAPPATDAIVPPPQKAVAPARKCSSSPPLPPKPAKQFPPSIKKGMYYWDVPDGIIAPRLSGDVSEVIAVVGLRGGSRVTGGLSARGLANAPVGDWSDDFTFIMGDHRYRCPSSVSQFLSPRVSKLHSIDATISELRLEVEDRDKLFGLVLEAAKGNSIAVDSAPRPTFAGICAALWNSELYELVYGQQRDEFTMDNVLDRVRFRSANRCDILAELKFVASHFDDFLPRPQTWTTLPFSLL